MTYQEKLKDPRWQKRRLEVFNKAMWKCEDCWANDKELQVHHCYYIRSLQPWEHGDDLLICVCPECHKQRQEKEEAVHVAVGRWLRTVPPDNIEEAAWEFCDAVIQQNNKTKYTIP